ncbi:MAG: aromatic ring-hydroxylating dioxygenase subunit alpha [Methylotenera sp.]|nr:aromatic ring-hydroxylating dioxygenase subunit alpha [Methylotenera sp.]OQW69567.1 MAG: Rieske (2Fe-2S) protein [Proteobacteria bacterium ST_bin12]
MALTAILKKNPTQSALETPSQLPVNWYADAAVYQLEQQYLFTKAPKYVGHALMVPNAGDYYTLDWMHNAKALINQAGEIALLSNVCRHRQAVMLTGTGNTSHIVCPLHRWTYDLDGRLLGAPHFEQNPCLHLSKTPLQNWQGLLFEDSNTSGPSGSLINELNQLGCKQDFDFTNYHLDSVNIEHYNFNWKNFIEAYLEDYHVGPFHPGLDAFVDCENLSWDFGENFSAQTVGYKPATNENLSKTYQAWQSAVTNYHGKTPPKHGAIWFVYYPFLMIEWYPNVLVVSHLIPTGVDTCSNVVEFYYPEDIALFEREYVKAQQAAYHETAIEDKEICQRMHDGRKGLFALGLNETGPYQHPLETGLEHFHQWYRRQMEAHLP